MSTKLAASVFAFLLTFLLAISICTPEEGPLANKTIVIDPGHGGIYPGAVANGVREANVNLTVALKLREKLATSGATIIMTRESDVNLAPPGSSLRADLQARVDVAKNSNADIFISIHSNASLDPRIDGAISFYATDHSNNLARSIQLALTTEGGFRERDIRPANFYVLKYNSVPSALIELGFLTNPVEAARLTDDAYQNKLADDICNGIFTYFQPLNELIKY
jgi:N-acetylmuramoyl-L-alanine amidase